MTNIDDLQERINSAEAVLEALKAELQELKKQEQQEPESLFGRWATHPEYGRGIIISCKPDGEGEVRFAYRSGSYMGYVDTRFVRPESLTLDPATLTTTQDFDNAPEGTIAESHGVVGSDVYEKARGAWYATGWEDRTLSRDMPPCRVIRWGDGK